MQNARYLGREPSFETLRGHGPFSISMNSHPSTEKTAVRPEIRALQFSLTDEQFIALQSPRQVDGVAPTDAQVKAERTILILSGVITNVTER